MNKDNQFDKDVNAALDSGGLSVWYQPIYSRNTKSFIAAEALMRLNLQNQHLPTLRSVQALEQSGRIVEVGREIFSRVCCFLSAYPDITPPRIHVNLSCRQMDKMTNAEDLIAIARYYGVPPQKINFEITETEDSSADSLSFVYRLLVEGFSFSLDDFGNKLSNCSRLILYPVCVVKTDKTMIDAALCNKKAETILANILEMAHSVQCETIVEGIEKVEQTDLDILKQVNYFQGYAFAKPMPEDKYIEFLKAHNAQEGLANAI